MLRHTNSIRMRFIVYANTEQIDTIFALSLYPFVFSYHLVAADETR